MRERNAPFGGETTGHLFFVENYFADSGLIAALAVIAALQRSGKKLSELVDEYHRYSTIPETNFEVQDTNTCLHKLKEVFSEEKQDTLDGLSVEIDEKTWFNMRASNTEPLLRLNAESDTPEKLDTLVTKIKKAIES